MTLDRAHEIVGAMIRFPSVISDKLAGMLARRGFVAATIYAAEFDEFVEVWERRPVERVA